MTLTSIKTVQLLLNLLVGLRVKMSYNKISFSSIVSPATRPTFTMKDDKKRILFKVNSVKG